MRASGRPSGTGSRRLLGVVPVASVSLLLLVASAAMAFWSSAGTGSASVRTGTVNAPTGVSVSFVSGSVAVTWTGSAGTTPQGYYVVRTRTSDGVTAPACGTSRAALQASTSTGCTDSGVPAGTFTYVVSAVAGGWTSTSTASASLTIAATGSLAFTTQPSAGTSAAALAIQPTVTVKDAAGNPDLTYAGSVTLVLTTPAGATLACTANPKAATAGIVTFAGCNVDKAGTYTMTASAASKTSATSTSFTIVAAAASKVAFTIQPGSGTSQTAVANQPVVTVQDASGNTVTGNTSTVTLALTTPGGATLTCTANPKAATAGVVTFAGCKVDRAGSYTLTATDGSLTAATSTSFAITAGASTKVVFSTQPSGSTGGTPLATQPAVTVQDAFGNTAIGDTSSVMLALTTPNGAGLTCAGNPKAATVGVATFAGCQVNRPGTYTLTATASGLTSATSISFTIAAGAAAQVVFATQPGGGTGGTALGTQPVVMVQDAGGNVVTTDTSLVTLSLTTPNGATLTCAANPKAAASGVATFAGCRVTTAGTYTLTATDGTLTTAVSGSFTVTVGAAAKVGFTTQPGAGVGSAALGTQPVVAVQDAGGNTVPTDTSSVTLALTAAGGASLTCTNNPKAAVAGLATFAGCKIDKAGSYTLTATDGGLVTATSSTFVISVGPAAKVGFTSQPGGGISQSVMAAQPVVAVQDAGGNTVTSDTSSVTLTLTTSGGATLACTPNPKPAVAGVAAFSGCKVDKTGTYTLTATDGTLTTAVSNSFTITAGAPTQLRYVTTITGTTPSCPTGSLTVGNGGSLTSYVAILDTSGNLTVAPATVTTITLTRTPTSGGGNAPTPATLSVPANANPAVTSGSSLFKLPTGNQPGTTYTATAGALSTSCLLSK
jgi:trimeric autotransporter adhesin